MRTTSSNVFCFFFYLVLPLKVMPLIKEELQHLRFCLGEPAVYILYPDGNHLGVLNVSFNINIDSKPSNSLGI